MLATITNAIALSAQGADWSATANVQLATRAERNPALRTDGDPLNFAISSDFSSRLARRTETTDLGLTPSLRFLRNPRDSRMNRDEQMLGAQLRKLGERYSVNASARAARESTLTTELGTTGVTDVNLIRQSMDFGLQPQWSLTERLSVAAGANRQNASYPGAPAATLFGSRYTTLSANTAYATTPQISLTLAASAGRFDSDRSSGSSDSRNLTAQLSYSIAERVTSSVSVGPSWVTARGSTAKGLVYQARVERQSQRSAISLMASRSASPSGYGVLTQRDNLTLALSAQISESLSASTAVSAVRTSDLLPAAGLTFGTVSYLRADASLSQRIAEGWSASLGAGWARQQLNTGRRTSQSFDARVAINWSGEVHAH